MKKIVFYVSMITSFLLMSYSHLFAQGIGTLSENNGTRYIRVAETGQLTDTVNVWGDVGSEGRYIIAEGTSLPELISFGLGYTPTRGRYSEINWGNSIIKVKVTRYIAKNAKVNVKMFKYNFDDPEPAEMFDFKLKNNDIVSLQVKRKPTFRDYVQVIAPVVSVIATSVLLFKNL